jgi:hypothetical protein
MLYKSNKYTADADLHTAVPSKARSDQLAPTQIKDSAQSRQFNKLNHTEPSPLKFGGAVANSRRKGLKGRNSPAQGRAARCLHRWRRPGFAINK